MPDVDFGFHIADVIVGGLTEYLSMVLGFNHLLIVAIAFYILSAVLRIDWRSTALVSGI